MSTLQISLISLYFFGQNIKMQGILYRTSNFISTKHAGNTLMITYNFFIRYFNIHRTNTVTLFTVYAGFFISPPNGQRYLHQGRSINKDKINTRTNIKRTEMVTSSDQKLNNAK